MLVNKFAPEEATRHATSPITTPSPVAVNANVAEAIRKAVAQVAPGMKVVDIKKQ